MEYFCPKYFFSAIETQMRMTLKTDVLIITEMIVCINFVMFLYMINQI